MKAYNGDILLKLERDKPFFVRDVSSMTEQAGYIDAETQITRLMQAGVNLVAYRREMYDYPDGDVPADAKPDPTLDVGFDLADAQMINESLAAKAKKAELSAKAQEASKKAEGGTTEAAAEA